MTVLCISTNVKSVLNPDLTKFLFPLCTFYIKVYLGVGLWSFCRELHGSWWDCCQLAKLLLLGCKVMSNSCPTGGNCQLYLV